MNHLDTGNVTVVKSILIHKGEGKSSEELDGTHNAELVEWKCWESIDGKDRYVYT